MINSLKILSFTSLSRNLTTTAIISIRSITMNEDEQEKKLEQELRDGLNEVEPDGDAVDLELSDRSTLPPQTEDPVASPLHQPEINEEPVAPTPTEPPHHSSAGVVILQWLSYAFWAWLVIGLIWLVNLSLSTVLLGYDTSGSIPYALAASIVLLPVAFVVDLFYRKHEPIKKHGGAMIIMVIHAVLYALVTIGTLIGAVFIALSMLINDSLALQSSQSVLLYTTLFAALSFGYVFLRVLNPFKSKFFSKIFGFSMLAISAGLIIVGFVGPALNAISLRNDRLIESGLGTLSSAIVSYVGENDKLPDSLKDVELRGSSAATSLIEKGLVTYKPEGKVEATVEDNEDEKSYSLYRYQLCVTYNKESTYQYSDYYYGYGYDGAESDARSDDYDTYPDTYDHKAGDVCYKLQTYSYKDQPIGL